MNFVINISLQISINYFLIILSKNNELKSIQIETNEKKMKSRE